MSVIIISNVNKGEYYDSLSICLDDGRMFRVSIRRISSNLRCKKPYELIIFPINSDLAVTDWNEIFKETFPDMTTAIERRGEIFSKPEQYFTEKKNESLIFEF